MPARRQAAWGRMSAKLCFAECGWVCQSFQLPDLRCAWSGLRRLTGMVLYAAVVIVLLCCSVSEATAQTETVDSYGTWHFGYEMFQMLLEQNGMQPVQDADAVLADPEHSVIVIIGGIPRTLRERPGMMENYIGRGGRVLIASDDSFTAGRMVQFNGLLVKATSSRDRYQNHDDCIVVTGVNRRHELMNGVGRIVVNKTGWLSRPQWFTPNWDVAARLPACDPISSSGQPVLLSMEPANRSSGKAVMCADPSLFTNGMMWHGDNAILAINLSQLLAEGDRTNLLFSVENRFQNSYAESPLLNTPNPNDLPLPENMPEPELATMIRIANAAIKRVEESNLFNEALANRPRNTRPEYIKRGILFALVIAALLFVIWRLAANGPAIHKPMPNREMKSALDLVNGRRVTTTEFGLSVRVLARDLCRQVTGSGDPADWQRLMSANAVSGKSPVREKSVQKQMTMVLDLAVNSRTVHISRRRFEFIGRTIQELKDLHDDGRLLKSPDSENAAVRT